MDSKQLDMVFSYPTNLVSYLYHCIYCTLTKGQNLGGKYGKKENET